MLRISPTTPLRPYDDSRAPPFFEVRASSGTSLITPQIHVIL